jgi:hypothetical protein
LGTWRVEDKVTKKSEPGEIFTLTKQDEYNYRIQIKHPGQTEIETMFGYLSIVDGVVFLNAWDNIPEDKPKGYVLIKLGIINNDNVKLYPLTENIKEQFNSSNELKKFIAGNMSQSQFFDSPSSFKRIQ